MPTVQELEVLMTRFLGDNSDLVNKLKDIEKQFMRTTAASNKAVSSLRSTFTSFSNSAEHTALSLVKLDDGLAGVITNSVKLYADAEALKVSFDVLTGSTEQAADTLKSLYKFAAETPFTVPQVTKAAKQMLAYGDSVDNLIPTMKMLGEVSSGLEIPLKDLTYLYGTLRAQGVAMTIDLRQFAMRGIPIYLALAKVLNLVDQDAKEASSSVRAQIGDMVKHGRIDFEIIEQAFKQMTGIGGQFNGLMEKQSKTLKGLFTNMQDDIDSTLREIGETIAKEMHLKEAMLMVSGLAKDFKELDPEVKKNITRFLLLSAALVAGTGAAITFTATMSALGLVLGTVGTTATLTAGSLVALQVAAIGFGGYLAYAFSDAVDQMRGFNTELDRVGDGLKARQKDSDTIKEIVDNSIKLSRTFGADEKKGKLNETIENLGKSGKIAREELSKVTKELDDIRKNNSVVELGLFKKGEVDELVQQSQRLQGIIKSISEGQEKLRKEQEGTVGGQQGNMAEFTKLALKIKEETLELGKNHVEKMLVKAATDGLNASQLDQLKLLQSAYELRKTQTDQIAEEKKQRESLKDSVVSLNKSLDDELETLRDTTGQHKSLRLEQRAREMGIYKEVELWLALARVTEGQVFRQKEYNKLVEEWKHILEEMRTPQEKFLEQRSHLNKMLDRGIITFDEYNKGMSFAEKKMLDASDAAKALEAALRGVDAVLSGSAESKARINAFLELIKLQKGASSIFSVDAPMPRALGTLRPIPTPPLSPEESILGASKLLASGFRSAGKRAILDSILDRTGGFGNDGSGIGDPFQQTKPVNPLPPNETDKEAVNVLIKIYELMLQSSKKTTVTIEPVDINR